MKHFISLLNVVPIFLALSSILASAESTDPVTKAKLAGNRKVTYVVQPGQADSLEDFLSKGVWYGRLRQNTFAYQWDQEADGKRKDNYAQGIGGSLIYRSATLEGFSFTAGIYTSHSPFIKMDQEDIGLLKAGKDVLSRRSVKLDDNYNLTVLGQAFVEFKNPNLDLQLGRQLYESLYTASNDTKMIPNTFDGVTASIKMSDKSKLRIAWLTEQKLRDHTASHDVITFKDAGGDSWANQDDSAIHKGLSYAAFTAAGKSVNHDLWVMDYQNNQIEDLALKITAFAVPEVFQGIAMEGDASLAIGSWKFTPGVRVMFQLDDGAGAIGGAAISGVVNSLNPAGYSDPDSLDSKLWAIRGIFAAPSGAVEYMVAYSKVADEADFLTPWRAFPTGGYTRAMGQYNWRANNQTFMLQAKLNFEKLLGWDGMNSTIRYAIQDEDESKGYDDRKVLHIDLTQKLGGRWKNTELKFRYALVDDDGANSYAEYRFETNYLF